MNKKEKLIAATMIFIAIRSIKKAKKKHRFTVEDALNFCSRHPINAYPISYDDIYDFADVKKLEIKMGIRHQELGLPWDQEDV